MRLKVINSTNINLSLHPAELYTTYTNWPSNDAIGNDDESTAGEVNDPYNPPFMGTLVGCDDPSRVAMNDGEGAVGQTFEIRSHFREFARIELGGKWYRASDFYLWRVHFKFKKFDETDADGDGIPDPIPTDLNHDGDFTDEVWMDNGSSAALDNGGW